MIIMVEPFTSMVKEQSFQLQHLKTIPHTPADPFTSMVRIQLYWIPISPDPLLIMVVQSLSKVLMLILMAVTYHTVPVPMTVELSM